MAVGIDLLGKKVGRLTVIRMIPRDERTDNQKCRLWQCKCDCGNIVNVRSTYLLEKGNYTQYSCGCLRKVRAFLASTKMPISQEFLEQFDNFERFLLIHKQLTLTAGKSPATYDIEEYYQDILYFYYDPQFNKVYDFWQKQPRGDTFYDWAKPSLDHIIPKSKGGSNKKENLEFLTVFENLSKRDMLKSEWEEFKQITNTQSDYFIESILKGGTKIE